MQIKQKLKNMPQLLLLSMLLCVAQTAPVFASGDAYFSLSPSSGSHTLGSSFTVAVSETSSSSDNTNTVGMNMVYDPSLLQYTGTSLGAFTLCGGNSGGGGSVTVDCAYQPASAGAQNYVTGTQSVANVSFKVIGSSTTQVSIVSSSNIENTSGSSVWDGATKQASFSVTATSSAPKAGSNTTSSTKSTTAPTTSPSTTAKPTTTATKPTTTSTTATATTTSQPALAAVTIIVVDATGQPVKGATVVLDGKDSMTTDSQGKANFAAENGGSHTVAITDPGKKPYSTKVSLTTGQSIPIEMQLTDAKSSSWLYIGAAVIGALLLIGVGLWFFRPKRFWPARTRAPIQITPTPAPVAVPVAPATPPTPRADQQSSSSASSQAEVRQNRSFYLRRRDSFDGIRGRH